MSPTTAPGSLFPVTTTSDTVSSSSVLEGLAEPCPGAGAEGGAAASRCVGAPTATRASTRHRSVPDCLLMRDLAIEETTFPSTMRRRDGAIGKIRHKQRDANPTAERLHDSTEQTYRDDRRDRRIGLRLCEAGVGRARRHELGQGERADHLHRIRLRRLSGVRQMVPRQLRRLQSQVRGHRQGPLRLSGDAGRRLQRGIHRRRRFPAGALRGQGESISRSPTRSSRTRPTSSPIHADSF